MFGSRERKKKLHGGGGFTTKSPCVAFKYSDWFLEWRDITKKTASSNAVRSKARRNQKRSNKGPPIN